MKIPLLRLLRDFKPEEIRLSGDTYADGSYDLSFIINSLDKIHLRLRSNGQIQKITYCLMWSRGHRDESEGPAEILFYENNVIKSFIYMCRGRIHRSHVEGPAEVEFFASGDVKKLSYRVDGCAHRPIDAGPANILFDYKDNPSSYVYCECGKVVSSGDFKKKYIKAEPNNGELLDE